MATIYDASEFENVTELLEHMGCTDPQLMFLVEVRKKYGSKHAYDVCKSIIANINNVVSDTTPVGLAKAITDRTAQWVEYAAILSATMNPAGEGAFDLTPAEKSLVDCSRKLEAIKLLRERMHLGLREAKDMVDAYAEKRPYPPLSPR